ncbi:Panacea domain-containing protein [Lactiplantibacillus modestisalitolerans]|uniref:Panacea domain-containing protein n=1 Tax=Lactiplantibacillus modestisalitolerans TaxID=1457219 RepID=A0ABV5WUV4_9LACO|nr:type II toxin-antitoxin system antitoxin SocA domain-containing protein [Lactiplantibacillus modestisalitolerans]
MYNINDVAAWFISKEPMSDKKLQKLSYYAVAWGWALFNKSIIDDDKFEAWVHGPVSPTLYQEYKEYGWTDIDTPKTGNPDIGEPLSGLLESVWVTYGDKSGNELEALTHSEAPWQEARIGLNLNAPSNNEIATKTMRNFYLSIYNGD